MRRLNISQSIGDICSRYENSTNNDCNSYTNNNWTTGFSSTGNFNGSNKRWSIASSTTVNGNNNANGCNYLQKSHSEVICKRGFKPSDRHDPQKRRFLNSLTTKFWKKTPPPQPENDLTTSTRTEYTESRESNRKKIDLKKLFTPAADFQEHYICPRTHKKMYASSSFYSPNHPSVEEQLELARRISRSLSDISNQRSKGQSMYVNRKKRSVKWVHEGEGKGAPLEEESSVTEEESESKKSLKLVMNPRGHVQDLESLRRMGYNIEPGALSPEICFDLVKDMYATKGKGAELFAKRRKKSEKWVIQGNGTQEVERNNKEEKSQCGDDSRYYNCTTTDRYHQQQTISQNQSEQFDSNAQLKTNSSTIDRLYNNKNYNNTESKLKFTEELYKPKIPRGWNTSYEKQPNQVYNNGVNGMSVANPASSQFQYFEGNNYNTAPRGWQPSMRYYRPITFQKRNSYTDF